MLPTDDAFRIANKRVHAELRQQLPSDVQWYPTDATCRTLRVRDSDAIIQIDERFPFHPPVLKLPPDLRVFNIGALAWLCTVARRSTNRKFLRHPGACLCCSAPSCHWSTQRRLSEVAEYALCMDDARKSVITPPPNRFALLPSDILELIADFLHQ